MGISKMQGTPWHIEKISHEKREKMRCKEYDPFDRYCLYRGKNCVGTYYCMYYKQISSKEYAIRLAEVKKKKKNKASSNKGIPQAKSLSSLTAKKNSVHGSPISHSNNSKIYNQKPPTMQHSIKEGMTVFHIGYGKGKVLSVNGDSVNIQYGKETGIKKQKISFLITNNLLKF